MIFSQSYCILMSIYLGNYYQMLFLQNACWIIQCKQLTGRLPTVLLLILWWHEMWYPLCHCRFTHILYFLFETMVHELLCSVSSLFALPSLGLITHSSTTSLTQISSVVRLPNADIKNHSYYRKNMKCFNLWFKHQKVSNYVPELTPSYHSVLTVSSPNHLSPVLK